jgi:uncharacterized membrane protein YhiD involved in acid resistance
MATDIVSVPVVHPLFVIVRFFFFCSAAIPSGVGFLGSALIWKQTTGEKGQDQRNHVHGITTAASVWLSASVGIGVGGALYVLSIYTVALVVFVLRLGPRLAFEDDPDCSVTTTTGGAESLDDNNNNNMVGKEEEEDNDVHQDDDHDSVDSDNHNGSREELFEVLKMEAQQQPHSAFKATSSRRSQIPKSVSYKKLLSQMHRESLRIQHKQLPNLHSD